MTVSSMNGTMPPMIDRAFPSMQIHAIGYGTHVAAGDSALPWSSRLLCPNPTFSKVRNSPATSEQARESSAVPLNTSMPKTVGSWTAPSAAFIIVCTHHCGSKTAVSSPAKLANVHPRARLDMTCCFSTLLVLVRLAHAGRQFDEQCCERAAHAGFFIMSHYGYGMETCQ